MQQSAPQTQRTVGVFLMAYGGPTSLEQVPEYLVDVREGRTPSDELVAEMTERYREIGGRSPILELTEAQARGVERELNDDAAREAGIRYRTYVGMRHWHPYIREVVPQALTDGVDLIVGVVMAPHFSRMSVGKYMKRLEEALQEYGADIPIIQVESWKDEPAFIKAVSQQIRTSLHEYFQDQDDVFVLFTAHSLPERILQWGDPYPEELRVSVEAVAQHLDLQHWGFAFQSQGATADPWLGPDVESTLEGLKADGVDRVLLVPIGFVCDHVEVLYDVDIEHRGQAENLGIHLERTPSLNDAPLLCKAVADKVRSTLERAMTAGSAAGE